MLTKLPIILAFSFLLGQGLAALDVDSTGFGLDLLDDTGENLDLKIGDSFRFSGQGFNIYAADIAIKEMSPNNSYQIAENQDTQEMILRGKTILREAGTARYRFYLKDRVLSYEKGQLSCLRLPSLAQVWSLDLPEEITCLDCYPGKGTTIYAGAGDGRVFFIDGGGKLKSTLKVFSGKIMALMATEGNELAVVGQDGGYLINILDPSGKTIGEGNLQLRDGNGPMLYEENIFIDNYARRYILCLSNNNGICLYDAQADSLLSGGAVDYEWCRVEFLENRIILADNFNGCLYSLDLDLKVQDRLEFLTSRELRHSYVISSVKREGDRLLLTLSDYRTYYK